jgi:hypothetical protein
MKPNRFALTLAGSILTAYRPEDWPSLAFQTHSQAFVTIRLDFIRQMMSDCATFRTSITKPEAQSYGSYAHRAAYWIVASRYHTGQWSRGYAKLSQLSRMRYDPGLATWQHQHGSEERQAAAALLRKRRREIRLEW